MTTALNEHNPAPLPSWTAKAGPVLLVLLVVIFALCLWSGPRIADKDTRNLCATNIVLAPGIGQSLNCDSLGFIWPAHDLSLMLGPSAWRQDRPGIILFAHYVSLPLNWYLNHFQKNSETVTLTWHEGGGQHDIDSMAKNDFLASYTGFLLLNILVLMIAYDLYLRAIGLPDKGRPESGGAAAALAGALIFINNDTKEFMWSAHTQMFHILAALLAIRYFVAIQAAARPGKIFIALALACGIGMLFYSVFVVPITVVGLGYLWRERALIFRDARGTTALAIRFAAALALFVLPYALWYGFIVFRNGAFYHYDIEEFNGFVWLPQLIKAKGWAAGFSQLALNFRTMWYGAFRQGWVFAVILAVFAFFIRDEETVRGARPLGMAAFLYALLTSVFFTLYGLAILRLAYALVLTLFPLLGFYMIRLERTVARPRLIFPVTAVSLLCYTVFMLIKFGPYS